jgi:hypothetical protein
MRSTGNLHPEWGYLAPAPSFMRTLRLVLVAATVGATGGAAAMLSLDRSGERGNTLVAVRTVADRGDASVAAALPKTKPTVVQQREPGPDHAPAQASLAATQDNHDVSNDDAKHGATVMATAPPPPRSASVATTQEIPPRQAPETVSTPTDPAAAPTEAGAAREKERVHVAHKARKHGRFVMRRVQRYSAPQGYSQEYSYARPPYYQSW